LFFHVISQRRAFAIRELVRRAGSSPSEINRILKPDLARPDSN
jgi:hypothetical protein